MQYRSGLFLNHVQKFMKKARLFPPSGKGFIAVSGGRDSVALLYCLKTLKEKEKGGLQDLIVLHVNHSTRPENGLEAELVKALCLRYGLEYREKVLFAEEGKKTRPANFEHRAREERYSFFHHQTAPGDRIYTAHHIDDSFEWSLLQQLRSGSKISSLGIPVLSHGVARPFMCVTRKQIESFVRREKLEFREDPSNRDMRYDRNFLRHKVSPPLQERFPAHLKHYVYRANHLALEWGKSVFSNGPSGSSGLGARASIPQRIYFQDPLGTRGYCYDSETRAAAPQEEIRTLVHQLSSSKRGVLGTQIQKLHEASQKGKWGPLSFSGNVFGHCLKGSVGLMSGATQKKFLELDRVWWEKFQKMGLQEVLQCGWVGYEQFCDHWKNTWADLQADRWGHQFPFWVVSWDKKHCQSLLPSLKKPHPLWPRSTGFFVENNLWFRPAWEVMAAWEKMKKRTSGARDYTYFLSQSK